MVQSLGIVILTLRTEIPHVSQIGTKPINTIPYKSGTTYVKTKGSLTDLTTCLLHKLSLVWTVII